MSQYQIRTCRSESYTDYTVYLLNPYILERLCFNACRTFYTDYTDFTPVYTPLYIRIKKSKKHMRVRARKIKIYPYNPYNPYKAYLKPL